MPVQTIPAGPREAARFIVCDKRSDINRVDFARGAYMLDTAAIRHLVDAATTADPRYTPSTTRREAHTLDTQARYGRWQTAYRALKQRRPQMSNVWYARQIAKQTVAAACQADTIRRHMTGRPGAIMRRG